MVGANPSNHLQGKINEGWTDKYRHVARKLIVEGGWVPKRLWDTGWSDEKRCWGCSKEEGTEKHRMYHCPSWRDGLVKWEQRARTWKEDWKWQR